MGFFSTLMTNEYNERIANKNLDFQRETFDYEKALQNQIFNREDTSYQRTVNDMQAAGLSPLSMNGTNSAGEAISMESPQNQHRAESADLLGSLSQIFGVMNQFKTMQNNSTLAQAQADLIDAQASNQRIKNLYENDLLRLNLGSMKFDNFSKQLANINSLSDLQFNQTMGFSPNMPDWLKQSLMFSKQKGINFDYDALLSAGANKYLNQFIPSKIGVDELSKNQMFDAVINNKLFGLMTGVLGKVLGGIF